MMMIIKTKNIKTPRFLVATHKLWGSMGSNSLIPFPKVGCSYKSLYGFQEFLFLSPPLSPLHQEDLSWHVRDPQWSIFESLFFRFI